MAPGSVTPAQYLSLSEAIAYRLSATTGDPRMLLNLILEGIEAPCDPAILIQAIKVILIGYGSKRRKMGPLAVIHPLRAMALRARAPGSLTMLALILLALHDRDEDLTEVAIGTEQFHSMMEEMDKLNAMLTPEQRWLLGERVNLMTHKGEHTYNEYLAEIMSKSQLMPDLIEGKLTDRLDNTLDVGVSLHGVPGQGAFGTIFDVLFLPTYPGLKAPSNYIPLADNESRQILANLFKNAEFVNLLRTEGCFLEGTSRYLRDEVITASLRITRFLVQDAFARIGSFEQKAATLEVLGYCQSGGLAAVYAPGRAPEKGASLDGLFAGSKSERKDKILSLVTDSSRLARVAVLFLAVFASFRSDPTYQIRGIDRRGVRPVLE